MSKGELVKGETSTVLILLHMYSCGSNGQLVFYQQVRQLSFCMMVVVVSQDPDFLAAFARRSLSDRLLVWATRLVVVTSLSLLQIRTLLPDHWTFSMMNTIFLNLKNVSSRCRQEVCEVFVKLRFLKIQIFYFSL